MTRYLIILTTPTTMSRPSRANRWTAISTRSTTRWWSLVSGFSLAACAPG
jgi:hypothetical protein